MLADHELDRLAKVEQHEGLIVEANERPWSSTNEIAERVVRTNGFAVALDRVRNPYNVGAVLRSAAFFGAEGTIVGAPAQWPALDAQAVRVAEGGAERLLLARTTTLGDSLGEMKKKGVRVVGADGHAKNDAKDLRAPIVLVLGNEREGLHDRVRAQCDDLVAIRGSGSVESLNVAVAAGILLSRCAMG
jgi:tRNA G18 (ribose-2'-O)-methylase SpoU